MTKFLFAAIAVFVPTFAFAETQLERLESISEQMNDAMFSAMIRMVEMEGGNPEPLRAAIPDNAWDDDFRAAGGCVLDRFVAASSSAEVDKMLDDMEAFVPQMAEINFESMDMGPDFLPDGISEDFSMKVNEECGLTDIMMDRWEKSGFMAAMMQSMVGN